MGQLILVGSVPLETTKDVFEQFGQPLAPHLDMLPDGEVGPRRYWVSGVHYRVFAIHPDLEVVRRPRRDNGVERLVPHDQTDTWQFRLKDGVKQLAFGDPGWRLGFALDAINSHALMSSMKREGKLPQHLRLQVSLPAVNSVCAPANFPVAGDLDIVRPGFTAAMKAEVATLTAKIPQRDLAIQFDLARETIEASGGVPGIATDASIEASTVQIRALAPSIPEEVQLGYHFCFGTMGGWPRFSPSDLGPTVKLANAVVAASKRRVDWIHIPVLPDVKDEFFAPLAGLKASGARVYLGMVHTMQNYAERMRMARKYLPDFGVGAYCGFGREAPSEMDRVLKEHLQAVAP
jgi:hypothetical protein